MIAHGKMLFEASKILDEYFDRIKGWDVAVGPSDPAYRDLVIAKLEDGLGRPLTNYEGMIVDLSLYHPKASWSGLVPLSRFTSCIAHSASVANWVKTTSNGLPPPYSPRRVSEAIDMYVKIMLHVPLTEEM